MHGKLDLNLFIVLRAVYEHGSITKAANALHITQPAVSHALGRLRDKFDDPLFIRHGRQVAPTPFCQSIITSVVASIEALENTLKGKVSFDISDKPRQVNLGLRDILESIFFPTLIPELVKFTPNITVDSRQVTWPELAPALANKELDIVIDALVPTSSDIRSQFICEETFVVVCAPTNRYLENPSVKNYSVAQHVLVSLKDSKLDTVDLALAQHNLHRKISLQCEHYFAAVNVVSQCGLLLTMPTRFAQQFRNKFDIEISPLPFEVPPLPVHMYWHKNADDDLVNIWMREKLLEVANKLGL
ncbi:LysR family transcriptional regulator [Alteromonas mediterranea]|uniref:LysR family transcriptional regulator n=1 Tax=Alteromonas mediterranea TaxID=314275 RepID=UPI0009045CCB|nr:LysR family transcriptional regulator [Alteromonas mediterranea]APD94721.1 LysR family transcriptional regulator [Alteromonas mediterranea]APD98357.1 LysR family transcriptional regulator [Alteromonas mediterranea]